MTILGTMEESTQQAQAATMIILGTLTEGSTQRGQVAAPLEIRPSILRALQAESVLWGPQIAASRCPPGRQGSYPAAVDSDRPGDYRPAAALSVEVLAVASMVVAAVASTAVAAVASTAVVAVASTAVVAAFMAVVAAGTAEETG